jgi:hypothetical protein
MECVCLGRKKMKERAKFEQVDKFKFSALKVVSRVKPSKNDSH